MQFYQLGEQRNRDITACQIVQRAYQQGFAVTVCCNTAKQAQAFDTLLWQFQAEAFVPHSCLDNRVVTEQLRSPEASALVNLADTIDQNWQQHERVAELIPADPEQRDAARQRFRQYRNLGIEPELIKL